MTTPKTKILGLCLLTSVISAALPSPAFAMSWSHFWNFFKTNPSSPDIVDHATTPSPVPSATPSSRSTPIISIAPPVPTATHDTAIPENSGPSYKPVSGYGTGPSAPDGSQPFTMQSLMNLIQSNQVTSVDQLLPLLPQSYRSNFVLMLQSGSSQTATPTSPRVIAYGNMLPAESIFPGENTDRLYLAFQTDTGADTKGADTKLPNSLEVIEWVPEQRNYQFYQLDFPLASNKISPQTSCKDCHGMPLRPNWTAYPRWDGALGNNNRLTGDFFPPPSSPLDHATLDQAKRKIEALKKDNDRLKSFDLSAFALLGPDYEGQKTLGEIDLPNANMSGKIGAQLQLRDVDVIRSSPDFEQFKYAFAGAFIGCVNYSDFFDARTQDALQAGVYANLPNVPKTIEVAQEDLNFAKLWQMNVALLQRGGSHANITSRDVSITTWMRFLLEGRGKDNTLLLKNILGTPPFADTAVPNWNYDFVGFGGKISDFADKFLRNAAPDYPGFNDLSNEEYKEFTWDLKNNAGAFAMRTENGPATQVCQQLATKSRAATSGYGAATAAKLVPLTAPAASQPNQGSDDSSNPILPKFQKYCSTCHGADGDITLPLNDLEKLKAYRTNAGRSIEQRLLGKEMPPPAYVVQPSDDERKAMIEGLQN